MDLAEAKDRFQREGLIVYGSRPGSLFVATDFVESSGQDCDDGIRVYQNASALLPADDGRFTAVLPTIGQVTISVSGTLDELVPLVERVYRHRKARNQPLHESVRELVLGVADWTDAAPVIDRRRAASTSSTT